MAPELSVRVSMFARGRARADTQGRRDGAGSVTDRQSENPRVTSGVLLYGYQGGEALELRPWVYQRDDRRAAFARRSFLSFSHVVVSWWHWRS